MTAEPATKNDLQRLENELGARIDTVEDKLGARIDTVEDKLGARIDTVEDRLGARIDELGVRIDTVEDRLGARIDELGARIDTVDDKLDGVARQVAVNMEQIAGLTEQVAMNTEQIAGLRADLVTLREDMNRDIARHMQAGFESMREMFGVLQDLHRDSQARHDVLRRDFTDHTRDFVLHNEPS